MSSDDVPSLGGYVVNTSGGADYYGSSVMGQDDNFRRNIVIAFMVVMLIMFVVMVVVAMTGGDLFGYRNGFQAGFDKMGLANSGAGLRIIGAEPSDNLKVSGFTDAGDVTRDRWAARTGFVNHREAPYFPDVTNRVLRMENREKEAVRALGKINQERLRRASDEGSSSNPLPWGPFWDEWKKTHPLDTESVAEGFRENRDLLPNY